MAGSYPPKEELRMSIERFEIAMKSTNEMIWNFNINTNKVTRTKSFETVFGFHESEATAHPDFWHE